MLVKKKKLLIFFEKLEVDYVLFFYLIEGNNAFETTAGSIDGTHKHKS